MDDDRPPPRRTGRRAAACVATALGLVLLTGCGSRMSMFDPQSEPARLIEQLWWWMLGGSTIIFAGAVLLLGIAYLRRNRTGFPLFGAREPLGEALVVSFGIVIPVLTVSALFAVANFRVMSVTDAPDPASTELTVEIVGHQWWWEVRYPESGAVTANEIHIPVRTRVNAVVRTDDVIHSFWVPQLNRKIDTIPGTENRILLYAEEPGRYRGKCAEYCGLQHAHMALYVFAEPRDQFETWLRNMAQPAPEPRTEEQRRGLEVFLSQPCAGCHSIRGTEATGDLGPDLTHLQTRETLAALTIPNRKGYLAGWILDPQHVKPGNKMPGLNLRGPEFHALLAYLESLGFAGVEGEVSNSEGGDS